MPPVTWIVVVPVVADVEIADKLLPVLQQPFVLKTATVQLSASIGIALHQPDDPDNIELLIGRADRAMYAVKRSGKLPSAAAL